MHTPGLLSCVITMMITSINIPIIPRVHCLGFFLGFQVITITIGYSCYYFHEPHTPTLPPEA